MMTTETPSTATDTPAANADVSGGAPGAGETPVNVTAPEGAPIEGQADPASDPATDPAAADPADPAADPAADPEAEAAGAPEAYADFTLPEGFTLEEAAGTEFKDVAKAYNLNQSQAQKMVDLASGLVQRTLQGFQDSHQQQVVQWAEQAKADPEVGGRNYEANVQVALSAVSQFGDPELKAAFESMGLGNHPAFVRAFYRIGKAMNEGGFVQGQGSESPSKPANAEAAMAQRIAREQERSGIKAKT